jgi:hypothetical protein
VVADASNRSGRDKNSGGGHRKPNQDVGHAPHTTIMPELGNSTDNGRLTAGEMPRDARSTAGCSVS